MITGFKDLTSYINTKRPDDVVNVTVIRNEKEKVIPVKLTKRELITIEFNQIELSDIDESDKKALNLDYGVKISKINNPELLQYQDQLLGGIILSIDGRKATDISSISSYLNTKKTDRAQYKIITPNGQLFSVIF